MTLGERIRNRREEIGKTLAQVAGEIGKQEATVQRYESGNIKTLKYETIVALANALNTTPAFLMGWEAKELATPKWDSELVKENNMIFNSLSEELQLEALRHMRYLASLKETGG